MFPMEARVAMEIAQVDGTLECNLGSSTNSPSEMQLTAVDLNDTPFTMKEKYLARMRALSKTGDTNCLYITTNSLFDLYSQTTSRLYHVACDGK
jgi:hypothetical protein